MVDINLVSEGKKFPTLTSLQDLFNITDSKFQINNIFNLNSRKMSLLFSASLSAPIL
jgi:hypothetical protein